MNEKENFERQVEVGQELVNRLLPAVDAGKITAAEALVALTGWRHVVLREAGVPVRRAQNKPKDWTPAKNAIVAAIGRETAKPYFTTGAAGLHARRDEMPDILRSLGKQRFYTLTQELLAEGRIIKGADGFLRPA